MDKRFPVGLTITVAAALAILIGLGVWQLQRLEWKRDLLTRIEAARTAPAVPIGDVLGDEDPDYRRVVAVCPGIATAPYVELYALVDGQMGSRLISACPLEGAPYGSVLVDRGFVAETISARPPVQTNDPRPGGVRGVLRRPHNGLDIGTPDDPENGRFYSRRVEPIAAALGATDPAPVFLMAETSTNPDWAALKPMALPADIANRHLEYAATWFGLAVVLLGVYAAMLRGRFKG